MTHEATPQNPLAEASPRRPVWSALTRLWSPATAAHEVELGYESALPWTLGEEDPADGGETRY